MTTRYVTILPSDLVPDAADADAVHRQTMSLYASATLPGKPGERRSGSNILWRREADGLLVTADLPATDLPAGARASVITRHFAAGDQVHFTATFDATVRVKGRDFPAPDPGEWFHRKAADALTRIRLNEVRTATSRRRGARFEQVTVTGTATVADTATFERLLREGIGRSKAFGCGLLTARAVA